MNILSGDYYSVSSNGYVKHSNVEVRADANKNIGVYKVVSEYMNLNLPERDSKEIQRTTDIIKEEDAEYETPHQSRLKEQRTPSSEAEDRQVIRKFILSQRGMMERDEVSSINMEELNAKSKEQGDLRHSFISNNNTINKKGILKRSLMELPKNKLNSQDDQSDSKTLYLELEKEKQLRKNLEKSYKDLLTQLNRRDKIDDDDLINQNLTKTKELFNKTQKFQKLCQDSQDQQDSQEELQKSGIKTARERNYTNLKKRYPRQQSNCQTERAQATANQLQQSSQAEEEQEDYQPTLRYDYFQNQMRFQDKVFEELTAVNDKINHLERTLYDREMAMEKDRIKKELLQKQKLIMSMENENMRLKTINDVMFMNKPKESQSVGISFNQNMLTNGLLGFLTLLIVMLIVKQTAC